MAMLSWKPIALLVAAAIAINGVVGVGEGGVWTTAPPTTSSGDSPVQSLTPEVPTATPTSTGSLESTGGGFDTDSLASDTGSDVGGSSAIDEGSDSQPGQVHPPPSSGDDSCSGNFDDFPHPPFGSGSIDFPPFPSEGGSIDFPPFPSGSGSIDFPPSTSDVSSGSGFVPPGQGSLPSSVDGSDQDSSTIGDSAGGEASTDSGDGQHPPSGGCRKESSLR
ncbi:hypothetical protein V7S43_009849 [Phytophthora oleae]|uniref:Uncharacterized protein n=1 Tax=Phytophthora oleae TaxID=2107226 RepID=A0ABD3FG32_9STRA